MSNPGPESQLLTAVVHLRDRLAASEMPVETHDVAELRRERASLQAQLDDYVIPRLRALDAPLLCVVGGSTGAGKSTLVNSLVGDVVSRAGVLRPTTRASVLVHAPGDEAWFSDDRVLPDLARVTGPEGSEDPAAVRLVESANLPAGLAILDAPDIDSVVAANRELAHQLLAAADLWVFVTTAARYADAVPWDLLRQAAARGTSVAIVLDRVSRETVDQIRIHLALMLREQGLGQAPVFTVGESELDERGLLPEAAIGRLGTWLAQLAGDQVSRSRVVRNTLNGALGSLPGRTELVARGLLSQRAAVEALRSAADAAYTAVSDGVEAGVQDGSLLRGEVLARWQELVGTAEFMRAVEVGVGRVRDRITAWVRGRPMPTEDLGEALQSGVAALVVAQLQTGHLTTVRRWRELPGGPALLAEHPSMMDPDPTIAAQVDRLVRDWQGAILELVTTEAGSRRTTARFLAFGVNGLAAMLMILAFSTTGGLTGVEVGIAGGASVLAQRLLEAVFGDQAVRELSRRARSLLLERVDEVVTEQRAHFVDLVDTVDVDPNAARELSMAARRVEELR